jgi:hypothetical protein
MYEHEDGNRIRRASAARTLGAPADEGDARALARQALQDSYDWRDDESCAWTSPLTAARAANAAKASGEPSAAARAEARRSRQEIVRSISRTVGV